MPNGLLPLIAIALLATLTPALAQTHPGSDAFVIRAEKEYGLDGDQVRQWLTQATFQPSIVAAMRRPAEGKPWYDYRPIFLTDERIEAGVEFWRENAELVDRVAGEFGVEPEVIMAIIGVETYYGRITGNYRVLDSLTTLGFYYPTDTGRDRSGFFAGELLEFMLLSDEEDLPVNEVTGSYAGAMGLGQFIPSSYRAYSVDFDGDGRRDLWRSTPDAVASVANYLAEHGWRMGQPVAVPARVGDGADPAAFDADGHPPRHPLGEIAASGIEPGAELDPALEAAVLALEQKSGDEHWLTFQNFYVITRYNRSPKYAMAVYQLSEALRQEMRG